jgi:hypothetical protein
MSRVGAAESSDLLDLYTLEPDRAVLEGIDRLVQSQDEPAFRDVLDVFSTFLKDRKRFAESVSVKAFDGLIEGLLNVCNTPGSGEVGRALSVLLGFLNSGTNRCCFSFSSLSPFCLRASVSEKGIFSI